MVGCVLLFRPSHAAFGFYFFCVFFNNGLISFTLVPYQVHCIFCQFLFSSHHDHEPTVSVYELFRLFECSVHSGDSLTAQLNNEYILYKEPVPRLRNNYVHQCVLSLRKRCLFAVKCSESSHQSDPEALVERVICNGFGNKCSQEPPTFDD